MNSNSGTTEKAEFEKLLLPHLLVIDEFNVRSETQWENTVLDNIVDKRYDNGVPTIIITNHTKDGVMKSLGSSISRRLEEIGGIVEFKCENFRRKQ